MDTIMQIWHFLQDHWAGITGILLSALAVAKGITSMTKSESDDKAVEKAESWINKILSLFKKKEDVGDDKPDSK